MFAVLIYHSYIYPWEFNVQKEASASMNYNFMGILSVCVPLFFLANGYLLLNRPMDLKKHGKRTLQMLLLTIFWAVFTLLVLMPVKQEFFSLGQLIGAVMEWKEGWIHHLWFMGALVCLYIFFPLLKTAYDHDLRNLVYFTVVCAVMTFGNKLMNMLAVLAKFLLTGTSPAFATNWFNIFNPFAGMYGYIFVYFCVGGFLFHYDPKIREKFQGKKKIIALAVLILSCLSMAVWGQFYYQVTGEFWDIVFKGYDTIPVFLNVMILYGFSLFYDPKKENFITRFISMIARNTLGIYFLHQIFFYMTVEYVKKIPGMATLPGGIVYSLMVLGICGFLTEILKKIPGIRKLF